MTLIKSLSSGKDLSSSQHKRLELSQSPFLSFTSTNNLSFRTSVLENLDIQIHISSTLAASLHRELSLSTIFDWMSFPKNINLVSASAPLQSSSNSTCKSAQSSTLSANKLKTKHYLLANALWEREFSTVIEFLFQQKLKNIFRQKRLEPHRTFSCSKSRSLTKRPPALAFFSYSQNLLSTFATNN